MAGESTFCTIFRTHLVATSVVRRRARAHTHTQILTLDISVCRPLNQIWPITLSRPEERQHHTPSGGYRGPFEPLVFVSLCENESDFIGTLLISYCFPSGMGMKSSCSGKFWQTQCVPFTINFSEVNWGTSRLCFPRLRNHL